MKDMFFNYDNDIKSVDCPPPHTCSEQRTKILASEPVVMAVIDIKGNELGLRIKSGFAFDLFFNLDGDVAGSTIDDLVYNSTVSFQLIDHWKQIALSKEFSAIDIYNGCTLHIHVNQSEAETLRKECYNMKVVLAWPGGKYEVFSENNGFLMFR